MTTTQMLQAGGLTHDEIASTPDFGTLFVHGVSAEYLRRVAGCRSQRPTTPPIPPELLMTNLPSVGRNLNWEAVFHRQASDEDYLIVPLILDRRDALEVSLNVVSSMGTGGNMANKLDFHALIYRFEERLPDWMTRSSRFLREPTSRMWRIPAAALLIVGGVVGFLPILGFWMVPLGLLLLAVDLPVLRPPLARLMRWIERKWPPAASHERK